MCSSLSFDIRAGVDVRCILYYILYVYYYISYILSYTILSFSFCSSIPSFPSLPSIRLRSRQISNPDASTIRNPLEPIRCRIRPPVDGALLGFPGVRSRPRPFWGSPRCEGTYVGSDPGLFGPSAPRPLPGLSALRRDLDRVALSWRPVEGGLLETTAWCCEGDGKRKVDQKG